MRWIVPALSGLILFCTTSMPRRAIADDSPAFYRGINLNGPALTIDGHSWEAGDARGVSCDESKFENQSVPLAPATDDNRARMIRSSRWSPAGKARIRATEVPAGTYSVYLYVWEDNNSQTFDVQLAGRLVAKGYPTPIDQRARPRADRTALLKSMFTLDQVVPWGRSFDEYRRMFELTDEDLCRRVVGCADGPASFNAETTRRGGRVVSCDPLYQFPLLTLAGEPSIHINAVMESARSLGLSVGIEPASYEFQRGGNQMLRIRR